MGLSKTLVVLLFLGFICLMLSDLGDAKGFRGGRSFRSSRSYRSRARTRVRTRSVVRTRSRSFNYQHAIAIGAVAGYTRYSNRRYYRSHRNDRPQICVNHYDYKMDNGTSYTLFVCPQYDQSDDHVYCCGPEDRQKCCTWWDKPGNVAGVVIGILAFLGITALILFCCYRSYKHKKRAEKEHENFNMNPNPIFKSDRTHYSSVPAHAPPPDGAHFSPVSHAPPADMTKSYPQDASAPAYDKTPYPADSATATPYPVQVGGDNNTPYPTATGGGDAPYPTAQDSQVPYPTQPGSAPPYPPNPAPDSYPTTAPPAYGAH